MKTLGKGTVHGLDVGGKRINQTDDGVSPDDVVTKQQLDASGNSFEYSQVALASSWAITHNMGRVPTVLTVDNSGVEMLGVTTVIDLNNLQIDFSKPVSGKAYLG